MNRLKKEGEWDVQSVVNSLNIERVTTVLVQVPFIELSYRWVQELKKQKNPLWRLSFVSVGFYFPQVWFCYYFVRKIISLHFIWFLSLNVRKLLSFCYQTFISYVNQSPVFESLFILTCTDTSRLVLRNVRRDLIILKISIKGIFSYEKEVRKRTKDGVRKENKQHYYSRSRDFENCYKV